MCYFNKFISNIMKKIITIIILVALFTPLTTYAFSFSDLLWWVNKNEIAEEQIIELSNNQKITAQKKLAVWNNAYKQKDLFLLIRNSEYVNISESELNFILQQQLDEYNNPIIRDITISLVEDKIILEGYALRPLKGKVYMEVRVEVMEEQLYFHVIKARYKGLFVPASLVGRLIYKQLEPISNFFFNNEDIKLRNIDVIENFINFDIN